MKGENKATNHRNSPNRPDNEKTLITNLPLLFANGKPVSLDKITLPELEEFIPFMVKCSLGRGVSGHRDLSNCTTPEWWPKEEFPFSFPLHGPSVRHQKLNSLRSLVCRCYTYYDCEFLLKFSAQLSLMPPSNLRYVRNEDNETTCIYNKNGTLLVKFRNENLMYDVGKHPRKHLYPIIHSPSAATESNKTICIDLTVLTDDSSEDEKDPPYYSLKRMGDSSGDGDAAEENGNGLSKKRKKKKISRRLEKCHEFDFIEQKQPTVLDQDGFVNLFGLVRVEPTIAPCEPFCKIERSKTRLAKRFLIMPFSSNRGCKILANSRYTVNIQQHMDRIERHTSTTDSSTQICTRTTGISNIDDLDHEYAGIDDDEDRINGTWVHSYKWPSRSHNPRRLHRGPALKACYVKLHRLSVEVIGLFMKTVGTMTPDEWRDDSVICECSLIPVIYLEDYKNGSKTSDKSCSTRCNCKTGNDIRSTQNNPHNLKNVASHFGNSDISNNNNGNRCRNNDSKKHYSSTNQKSSLGRTRSNGPVLAEVPNFSYTSCATLDDSLPVSDKITPYIPLRLNCDIPRVKRVIRTQDSKRTYFKSIIVPKSPIVPQNIKTVNTDSTDVLFITSRNRRVALRKRNVPGHWETSNSHNLINSSEKSLRFKLEPLQENLIPNNELSVTKKRKIVTSKVKGIKT